MCAIKNPSGEYKSTLLLQIISICWLLSKLISWRVWTTYRVLPTTTFFELLDSVPAIIHNLLFVISIVLMIAIFFKRNQLLIISLLLLELLSCLLDQTRLQPWEYQYIFILMAYIINKNRPDRIPALVVLILASTYFYSGINKLDPAFLKTIWGNTLLRFFFEHHPRIWHLNWLYYSGYFIGIIEIIAGLGLLFKQTQVKAAIFLIAMHLVILLLFSPLALNFNKVILPWNATLLLYLYVIFLRGEPQVSVYEPIGFKWNWLFILFWVILPALSFVGLWDRALSSNLYSGRMPQMFIYIDNIKACKELLPFCAKQTVAGRAKLNVGRWALMETNTPGYMDMRAYRIIERKLIAKYPGAGFKFVYINNKK
jgi:hypothetical protein